MTNVDADEALARMGYQSELPRNLSMLSVLGLYVMVSLLVKRREREREKKMNLANI